MNPSMFTIMGIFMMLILFALGYTGTAARRCVRCRAPFCRACGETGTAVPLCPECLMEHLQISQKDPKEVWLRNAMLDRKVVRRSRWALVLGLLVPGLGHLFGRRPLRGLVWLVLIVSTLALLLGPAGFIPAWSGRYGLEHPASWVAPVFFGAILYVFGIADAFFARKELLR